MSMFRLKSKGKKSVPGNVEENKSSLETDQLLKDLSVLKEKLVELEKINRTTHDENEQYQQQIARLTSELSVANKNLEAQSNGATTNDSNVLLRNMLADQGRRLVELETAYKIIFARREDDDLSESAASIVPEALSMDEQSIRKRHEKKICMSVYSTLCKVVQGEPVAANNWAGDEGLKDSVLSPNLRSLEKLQRIFNETTANNDEDMVGLMNAAQLSIASNELDPTHSLTEVEATEAIASVRSHFSDQIESLDPFHIEFSEFVMVCVHCLGATHRQGESF